jgi:hypothetical protein
MGIRYYAYPVPAEQSEEARASPRDFIGLDPLADAWGPAERRPHMLYLDKCWQNLQAVFNTGEDAPERPAYELVRGEVTMTDSGWIAVVRHLDPLTVRRIADDLALVDECQVMSALSGSPRLLRDFESDVDYTLHYLADARAFTEGLARTGTGLAYLIG